MFKVHKILTALILLVFFSLTFASPARAFDGRSGDQVVISADEVVEDDVYVSAQVFVLDGTVNGDVVVVGQNITDDIRMAGSVLLLGEKASVGGDIIAAGYSLEARPGSTVGQDVVFAGGQTLLAAAIARNLRVATGGLELRGEVGGDVRAEVGEARNGHAGPPPGMFPSSVPVPAVATGLTIDPSARIHGDLEYTSSSDLSLPAAETSTSCSVPSPILLTSTRVAAPSGPGIRSTQHGLETVVRRSRSLPVVRSTESTYERPSFAASTVCAPTWNTW